MTTNPSPWHNRTVGLIFLVVIVGSILATCDKPTPDPRAGAIAACRTGIRSILNDPDSADFGNPDEAYAKKQAADTWIVRRAVRANNALGGKVLAVFECKVSKPAIDGHWRIDYTKQIEP